MSFSRRAIGILISFALTSLVFAAEANLDCNANQSNLENRPSLRSLDKMNDLLHWREKLPFSEEIVSKVPLAVRAPIEGPSALAAFDLDDQEFQYDFLSTRWGQGGCGRVKKTTEWRSADNVYNFKFWQYLDLVYYYGHRLITIPPTMWTNAAHKNGVISLGVFNVVDWMTPNTVIGPGDFSHAVPALIDLAKTLGFDGYLIHHEGTGSGDGTQIPPNEIEAVHHLMSSLRSAGLVVVWYDTPVSGGYASFFNADAVPFLNSAGYFQTNYWWGYPYRRSIPGPLLSHQTLQQFSIENLKQRVFQSVDVWRTPTKTSPTLPCVPVEKDKIFSRLEDVFVDPQHTDFYTGIGFFAPNWTMFGSEQTDAATGVGIPDTALFEQSDAAFWEGSGPLGCGQKKGRHVGHFLNPRTSILQPPFYSTFNTGVGKAFFIQGRTASIGPWSNFTLQSILPSWQNVRIGEERPTARAYFNYEDAYFGGSSWRIEDQTSSLFPVRFKLFKTAFTSNAPLQVDLILKKPTLTGSSALELRRRIRLLINNQKVLSPIRQTSNEKQWKTLTFLLPEGEEIQEIGIQVNPDSQGLIAIDLGSFKIYDPKDPSPGPKAQIPSQREDRLQWKMNQPDSIYLIYGRLEDHSSVLLNGVINDTYRLSGNIFNGRIDPKRFKSYVVQEVSSAGDFAALPR